MYTITTQGSFESNGLSRVIQVPQGIDWFTVMNYTQAAAYTANSTFRWTWYRGMAVNDFIAETNIAGHFFANRAAIVAVGATYTSTSGFTLIDSTTQIPSAAVATTATTNAAAPVVSTATTAPINIDRTVVRLDSIAACPGLCGIDFTVTAINPGVSFTMPTFANAVGVGGAGHYRIVSYDTNPLFYPVNRTVINITQAVNPVVTTSVVHGYTIGQTIRMKVPVSCGMFQMNNIEGVVIATPSLYTFTLGDIENFHVDSTGFTAFQWPLLAAFPFQIAEAIPVGEACSAINLSVAGTPPYYTSFQDATVNLGYTGMILGAGIAAQADSQRNSPAGIGGQPGSTMYWQAGKVTNL